MEKEADQLLKQNRSNQLIVWVANKLVADRLVALLPYVCK